MAGKIIKKLMKKVVNIIKEFKKAENKPLHTILTEIMSYSTRLSLSPDIIF